MYSHMRAHKHKCVGSSVKVQYWTEWKATKGNCQVMMDIHKTVPQKWRETKLSNVNDVIQYRIMGLLQILSFIQLMRN